MQEKNVKRLRFWVRFSIVILYLVIIAGAVVRMTGSGMGCPDWPKCFGLLIPPTQVEQITWKPNKEYQKGQIIVHDESLKVAQSNFKTSNSFHEQNWRNYTKHNYSIFNVYHTWTEYVNRLLGALSGLVILLTFIFSLAHLKSKPKLSLFCFIGLIGIILQGVLGKIVVDTLLSPYLISLHMILALLLVAWYIFILKKISANNSWHTSRLFSRLSLLIIGLLVVQIMLGVQVRQSVDFTVKSLGYENKHLWIDAPGILFYIHRSFSVLVLIAFYLYIKKGLTLNYSKTHLYAVALMLLINILTGMGMYYLDFPFGFQSLHLVFSALLIGLLFYIWLSVHPKIRSVVST